MSEWYQRQFGDRGEFALCISLGVDPHPAGEEDRDHSWGSLELWVKDRCLTSSIYEGSVAQGVRWNLLPVLEWMLEVGMRLVNEDPYPRLSKGTDVGDGSAWYDATLNPPVLSSESERRWYLRRSEWRHHHALRRAAEDVALPNVVFKRQGHDMEVSWDNESWSTTRPGLNFVERRGRVLVSAEHFGKVVEEALADVLEALATKWQSEGFRQLASKASSFRAGPEDWRWLVHRPTAHVIRSEMPALCKRLDEAALRGARGIYVPHCLETLTLRHVRLESKEHVEALLRAASWRSSKTIAEELRSLVRPRPAANERPWDEGNEYAEVVRDELGWGNDPTPDLSQWMPSNGIVAPPVNPALPSAVSVLTTRTDDFRAMAFVNPQGSSPMRKETGIATALGHVLLDTAHVSIDGDWEHWPTSARARAFGVALMLPEEGVRDTLGGARVIGPKEVQELMGKYRTGPWATTYRMKNLGLISVEEQMELARAVG